MSETLFEINENKEHKPVTCLGKVFENDEKRREYFREELRKKLPELKKIDGFPIGEDEDIIALSDPPYYTVCPNPWLDDFIKEWEAEKANHPGREENFIVKEPFASDVSEGKNNPIYNAHSYHTKVPHPAIMRYILHYTQPGDIVFDGFAGTGMTGVAAQMCGNPDLETKVKIEKEWEEQGRGNPVWGPRKAIVGDLSPIASFIAYNYNTPVDVKFFKAEAERVLKEVEDELGWMYYTLLEGQEHQKETIDRVLKKLPNCKTPAEAKKLLDGSGLKFGKINYTVWSDVFVCPDCIREFSYYDVAIDFENGSVREQFYCPHCNSERNKRNTPRQWQTTSENITNRIVRLIKQVPVFLNYQFDGKSANKTISLFDLRIIDLVDRMVFEYWYPRNDLINGDKMTDVFRIGIKTLDALYTRRSNIMLAFFYSRIENIGILKGVNLKSALFFLLTSVLQNATKLYSWRSNGKGGTTTGTFYVCSTPQENSPINLLKRKLKDIVKAFELDFQRETLIYTSSASQIPLQSDSIDYLFIDPPFGANLMYSELNSIIESWLRVETNTSKEAIENKTQRKGPQEYQDLMLECFREFFRIIKPGKWMTIEFSNTSAIVWNGIQTAIQKAGFVIANVSTLDKQQGGFNAVNHAIAVKQDLIISCYKPIISFSTFEQSTDMNQHVWVFVKNHLDYLPVHILKNQKTTAISERSPKILYDRLLAYYLTRGYSVPIDAVDFQSGLKLRFIERDGQYFTAEQAIEYDQKKAMTQEFEPLPIIVTNEREGIEWLRAELQTPQKHQDVQPKWLQAVHAVRKGDVIPELQDILQQNFIEMPDGKWRVPDMNEAKDRELIRNKALVKEFYSYVSEINTKKGKRLKEVRLEALIAGFKGCWEKKEFDTIVLVAEKIPQNLLYEDSDLLMFYEIAKERL